MRLWPPKLARWPSSWRPWVSSRPDSSHTQYRKACACRHRANWPKLDALLYEVKQASPLPEEAANAAECSAWLEDLRRAALGR